MSRSQVNILEDSITELYAREKDFEKACVDAADAEYAYRLKQAKEYLAAEGTEKARTATATVNCDKELRERLRTEAIRDFTKVNIVDSQQALSARQTLVRIEIQSDMGYANDRRTT